MIFKNMFQAKTALMAVAMVLFAGSFTACSDDDDNEGGGSSTLGTPEYADVSAKYEITSGGDIASIELTESGNYVVIMSNYSAPEYDEYMALAPVAPVTRSESSSTRYGKYIKISDTEFILEGYGSVVIEGDTNNAYSLQLSMAGSDEPVTLGANKVEVEDSSEASQLLCRSWDINKVNLKLYVMGKKRYDKTLPADQNKELWQGLVAVAKQVAAEYDDEEDEEYSEGGEDVIPDYIIPEYNPEQLIFTKAGSYMIMSEEEHLDFSYWGWKNRDSYVVNYSPYGSEYLFDSEYSNDCNITFNGSSMTLYEVNAEEIGEDEDDAGVVYMRVTSTYYCSEAH